MDQEDTIIAPATPIGQSGIGIVRMSGRKSFSIAKKIFRSSNGSRVNWSSTFRTHHGWIVDPENKETVDEVLLTIMRSPKTYTREDIVEINCHGGSIPLRGTLELGLKLGARLAKPGEFTRRAFLNGRIDLAQAESVLDVVQAKTDEGLMIAVNGLKGRFSQEIYSLKKEIVDFLSCLEAEIEFPDEEIDPPSRTAKKKQLSRILAKLDFLIEMGETARIYREGVKAVIIGRSNVGKSSLLNALLDRERAIVSCIPGTTRDTIEEIVNMKGFPLCIIDTAGLGKLRNVLDREGIKRTHSSMNQADIIFLMVDGSLPLAEEDERIFQKTKGKNRLILVNKIDLPQRIDREKMKTLLPKDVIIEISATRGTNLEKLKQVTSELILREIVPSPSSPLLINVRQKSVLEQVKKSLLRAVEATREGMPEEMLVVDLKEGLNSLGDITGETTGEDILDHIFSNFCIGK